MSRIALLLTGFVVGGVLAGGGVWLGTRGPLGAAREAQLEAERRAAAAERENRDWERKLQAEYARGQSDREEIELLKARLATRRSGRGDDPTGADPETAGPGHSGLRPPPPTPEELADDPLTWDPTRLRREFEMLAAARRNARKSPRLPRIAQAAAASPDDAFALMNGIFENGLSPAHQLAALLVMEKAGDERGVEIIMRAWPKLRDAGQLPQRGPSSELLRRAALRALAVLPGDAQIETFLEVWNQQPPRPKLRMVAMAGLAKRLHPVAVDAVQRGGEGEDKVPAALRARALESFLLRAIRGGFEEQELIPIFAAGLATADGKGQVETALKAFTGYWNEASVAALEAYAARTEQPAELTTRARRLADDIRAGKPRPEIPEPEDDDPAERRKRGPAERTGKQPPAPEETAPGGDEPATTEPDRTEDGE